MPQQQWNADDGVAIVNADSAHSLEVPDIAILFICGFCLLPRPTVEQGPRQLTGSADCFRGLACRIQGTVSHTHKDKTIHKVVDTL